MTTVTIYENECTKGYSIHDVGSGFSLRPWGQNTEYFEGFYDGGKKYELPSGYIVGMSNGGTEEIYDKERNCCGIFRHSSGRPQLFGAGSRCPVLELAEGTDKS